ncbi:FkbM family methyltransferase [Solidesulfovibrio carbinolicus]|uniref:Methyltransferase FkbM domain-containing protein n=1 Tax=Solidesulfovibrio carbinolicus TaxID=296842 RepID=A0A4V0YQJ7_9BACT|nr:FkbM family methyltransferase [Solidesulfovibrio carbinolicus]QAZ66542.1 hypothetical protein C3Y92_04510 [Solidesulfovibrio carbinolicus]
MTLKKMLRQAPLLRPLGYPVWSRGVVVVCFAKDLAAVAAMLGDEFYTSCRAFFIVDQGSRSPREIAGPAGPSGARLPVRKLFGDPLPLDADIALALPSYGWNKLAAGACALKTLGFDAFHVLMPMRRDEWVSPYWPDYYETNRQALERAYALLDDEESRQVFAARVRAVATGNIGYYRLCGYNEYYHPQVQPRPGDVVIDGGISADIHSQRAFCQSIGDKGRLYGFEPDPAGFAAASGQIAGQDGCRNFQLVPLGLWNEKTALPFASGGDDSRVVADGGQGNTVCEMTTMDAFVAENALERVGFIKLDVEGAEMRALEGAVATLARSRPRLAISVYHRPEDLFVIPLFLKDILPDSCFYLGHHTACALETVLYVLPR